MGDELHFKFSIPKLPDGEALTGSEIELRLLEELREDPGAVDSLWSLGMLYSRSSYIDQATACIRRVIELLDDPEDKASCHLALGQIEEQRQDFVAAAQRYREAFVMEPCSTRTWYLLHNNLGYSLNQTGDYQSALRYLQQAVVIDPTRPNAYKNLGLSHQGLGDLEQAVENFILATQANATDRRSLYHLDSLLEANPVLEVDVPGLRERVEACRAAVEHARSQQPDFDKIWEGMREAQEAE